MSAGAADGDRLSLVLYTNAGNKARETFLQTTVEQLEALLERVGTGSADGDGWLISWAMGPESDPFGLWHSSHIPDPSRRPAVTNQPGRSITRR